MTEDGQRYRRLSLWLDTLDDDLTPRPPLDGDHDVDVAIVGAGFTGLWTAYALLREDPALSVLLLEREIAGFGASGRNGGWCSDLFPVTWARLERERGRTAATAMHRAMVDGIADIAATLEREAIDADMLRGGQLKVARTPAQEEQVRAEVARSQERDPSDLASRWLSAPEATAHVRVSACRGASYTPNCARIHPGSWSAGWRGRWSALGAASPSRLRSSRFARMRRSPHGAQCARDMWCAPPRRTPPPCTVNGGRCCPCTR